MINNILYAIMGGAIVVAVMGAYARWSLHQAKKHASGSMWIIGTVDCTDKNGHPIPAVIGPFQHQENAISWGTEFIHNGSWDVAQMQFWHQVQLEIS
jgi:hypothetical protein